MDREENYWGEGLAKHYDAIVNSGYYDYDKDVSIMKSILGDRKRILELGVGTGNIMIKLAKAGLMVDGIEPSGTMIKFAREKIKKLGLDIGLYQQDVAVLNLSKTYQGVFSHGGVPVYIRTKKGIEFESYLNTLEENEQMLKRIYDILEKNGLFLVSIHAEHTDMGEFRFGDGLRYFPRVIFKGDLIEKTHYLYKGNEPVFEQTFYHRRFRKETINRILKETGFEILGQIPESTSPAKTMDIGSFYVMIKR
jgi:SAM-dependent methyltransferase